MENQIKMTKEAEQIFTNIYKNNGFNGKESISGPGSDTYQTRIMSPLHNHLILIISIFRL